VYACTRFSVLTVSLLQWAKPANVNLRDFASLRMTTACKNMGEAQTGRHCRTGMHGPAPGRMTSPSDQRSLLALDPNTVLLCGAACA
jgi:hypothetical protein